MAAADIAIGSFFLMMGFGLLVAALYMFFWGYMLYDCANRNFKSNGDKALWIIIILLFNGLGALIYYIAIKKNDR